MNYTIILFLASAILLTTDLIIGTVYLFLMGVSLAFASAVSFMSPFFGFNSPIWFLMLLIVGMQSLFVWQLHQEDSLISQWLHKFKKSKYELPEDFDIGNHIGKITLNEDNHLIANYQDSFWRIKILNGDFYTYQQQSDNFDAIIKGKEGNMLLVDLVEKSRYLTHHESGKSQSIHIPIHKK